MCRFYQLSLANTRSCFCAKILSFLPAYIYPQAVVLLLTILVAVVKISVAPFVYTNYDESGGAREEWNDCIMMRKVKQHH